ncbi:retrovirus-related pol polyprotein from transposon TNT 1-94 [Tanacetum coccineum]
MAQVKSEEGINYDETFAPVVRMEAIGIFLAFATYMNFKVYQMDVKSAFLNGKLKEEVYVKQPPGFESSEFPDYVCKLDKALYGQKQAPKALSAKKQNSVAMPLAENEYVAAAGCCASILWIKSQLSDYDIHYKMVPIFCDNTSAIAISNNPVLYSRTKHIDIRYHFIRITSLKEILNYTSSPLKQQTIKYAPQWNNMTVDNVTFQDLLRVVYQNFLTEFWGTAVAYDPFPSTDQTEQRPLMEFLIKLSILNGQRPLTLDFNTFCSSTGLDYKNGKYVAHPTPEGLKQGIILLILGGFAWCYTHAYIEDGVTFIAKSSVTFLAKSKSHIVLGIAPAAIIDCQLPSEYTITSKSTNVVVMALPVQNINHSAFRLMFEREKLSGNNFNDWFRQLKLVLRVEKKMYVIEQPLPAAPAAVPGISDLIVGLILNGLTKDFAGFVRNYNMHNMGKTIGELHAMLIEYEKGLPKKAETPQVMIIKGVVEEKRRKLALPVLQGFREARKLKQGALYLYVGNGVRAQVEAIGSYDLVLANGLVICLDNCHYAPSITRGVVSVHRLVEKGFV